MEKKTGDEIELNILDLDANFMIQICEYLSNLDFRKLYEAHPKFHDVINHTVRHKCLVLPLKWESEIDAHRQIENIKFFLEKFPLELYSLNLESENMENVRRLTAQFNEKVDQVKERVSIMDDDLYDNDEHTPESADYFKSIRIDLCEKVHYFAVLASTEHLTKMNLLEHVTPRDINYVESLIALPRSHTDAATTYYEYLQICHKLYGLFVLRFMPNVELLELSQCQLDGKLAVQLKNLQQLVRLTMTNVKQTSEIEIFFEEMIRQNKLECLSLHSREQNLPSAIICKNLLKMTNLKVLHLSIKSISYETFLHDIAINLKNLTDLEIITRDEFKMEWIFDFLRLADKINVLELDFNYTVRNWMKLYDELVELRKSKGNDKKLDVTLFGAVPDLQCLYLEMDEHVQLVLAPVVDRERHDFACRNLMTFVWSLEALQRRMAIV